jgi:hypothetical protein
MTEPGPRCLNAAPMTDRTETATWRRLGAAMIGPTLLGLGLVGASCGTGSSASSAGAPAAAATPTASAATASNAQSSVPGLPADPCSLAPAATINAVLGTSVSGPTRQGGDCVYTEGQNSRAVSITFSTASRTEFQNGIKLLQPPGQAGAQGALQAIPGVGDAAYGMSTSMPGLGGSRDVVTEVFAHKDNTTVLIACSSPLPQVEALAQRILTSVP